MERNQKRKVIFCCSQCKIVWNGDVNAGLNIFKIGYQHFVVGVINYTLHDL